MDRGVRVAAWGCVVLLAMLSLLPGQEMVRTGFGGRYEHLVAYAGTAFFVGLAYGRAAGLVKSGAGLVAYAGALEMAQTLAPGRHAAIGDFLAGAAGVLVGLALALGARSLRRSATP